MLFDRIPSKDGLPFIYIQKYFYVYMFNFFKKCIKKSLRRKISQTTQNDIKQKYFCAEITCNIIFTRQSIILMGL